jgi:hypothetical protein
MISFVKRKKRLPTRSEERANRIHNSSQVRFVPLGKVPARYAEPSIHLLPLATAEPQFSQKIEFVFSANPETSGREPQELLLRGPDV